jgi:hypothetical protein
VLFGRPVLLLLLLSIAAAVARAVSGDRILHLAERFSLTQREWLNSLPSRWVGLLIVSSAALSLLLELTLIRWQAAVFETFSFYKNFGLLACFAGLGLGYALSRSEMVPLFATLPALAWQVAVLTISRSGPPGWNPALLRATPVIEQLNMGAAVASHPFPYASILLLLAVTFALTALALLPIGQVCGALMDRTGQLRAYGLNLVGSILGVGLSLALSQAWTPPIIWYAVCVVLLVPFAADRLQMALGAVGTAILLALLAWPFDTAWMKIYSPYQLVEMGPDSQGNLTLRAAGHYYQRMLDVSWGAHDASREQAKNYYEFPYRVAGHFRDVAIVGAGTGNDVAAALRMGAQSVDAIEIDPVIQRLGAAYHPARPYQDSRVHAVLNDARTHLRNTSKTYDLVVYGLLDSHTALSHGSSVRLDSFVYTVEAFHQARARLRDGGLLSLSFTVLSPQIGHKVYLMLREAFGGVPPVCISAAYDGSVVFLERKKAPLLVDPRSLATAGFADVTNAFADSRIPATPATDDWPFFYMPRRVYPFSYGAVMVLLLLLSVGLTMSLSAQRPHRGQAEVFLLGVGFMLVETKNITELGLLFGNTWRVIGVVIAGILTMGFLANLCVASRRGLHVALPYSLLLLALASGASVAYGGGLPATTAGRLGTVALLSLPLFFSGLAFSAAISRSGAVSGAMAANLAGAMVGGFLEYNSMYLGFTAMYWLALVVYGLAMIVVLTREVRTDAGAVD